MREKKEYISSRERTRAVCDRQQELMLKKPKMKGGHPAVDQGSKAGRLVSSLRREREKRGRRISSRRCRAVVYWRPGADIDHSMSLCLPQTSKQASSLRVY